VCIHAPLAVRLASRHGEVLRGAPRKHIRQVNAVVSWPRFRADNGDPVRRFCIDQCLHEVVAHHAVADDYNPALIHSLSPTPQAATAGNFVASHAVLPNIKLDLYRRYIGGVANQLRVPGALALVAHQYRADQLIAPHYQAPIDAGAFVAQQQLFPAAVDASRAEYFDARNLELHRPLFQQKCRACGPGQLPGQHGRLGFDGCDKAEAMRAEL
jgi:hypothetical protein